MAPQPAGEAADDGDALTRVDAVLRVAASVRTGLSVESLSELLPEGGPRTAEEVSEWLSRHPAAVALDGDVARHPTSSPPIDLAARRARGERYFQEAERFIRRDLGAVLPLVRSVAVTGSTAFGEPESGDDLDLLVVVRPGSLWVFLAYAYLSMHVRGRPRSGNEEVQPCLNYVMDETEIRREFAVARGFQFAREALSARPIFGSEVYRGLVGSAPWLRDELPRLYARWERQGLPSAATGDHAPFTIRCVNLMLFPMLATYLRARNALRNRQLRQVGNASAQFTTVARLRRLTFESERFQQLGEIYRQRGTPMGAELGGRA